MSSDLSAKLSLGAKRSWVHCQTLGIKSWDKVVSGAKQSWVSKAVLGVKPWLSTGLGCRAVSGAKPCQAVLGVMATVNDVSYGIKIWTDLFSVLSQSTRLTDRQTDRILITRPRLHSMQCGKNVQ